MDEVTRKDKINKHYFSKAIICCSALIYDKDDVEILKDGQLILYLLWVKSQ